MSKYRKIDTKIWNDAKFRALSDDGQMIFLLFLTHPNMTALGALPATVPGMAHARKWSEERFRKGLSELLGKGMVKADEDAGLIYLPNFLRYNQPENPNVVKAWAGGVDMLPECEMKNDIIAKAYASLSDRPKSFAEAFVKLFGEQSGNGSANGMANQEPEPEQEPEPLKPAYDTGKPIEGTYTREEPSAPAASKEKKETVQQPPARQERTACAPSPSPEQNPYLAAKGGGSADYESFPIPRSTEAGKTFLREHRVPYSEWDRFLPVLMKGALKQFDINAVAR